MAMRGDRSAPLGLLVGIALAGSLGLPSLGHAADAAEESQPVRIGVLASRGADRCLQQWGPTAEYLSGEIAGRQFEIRPLRYDEVGPAVERAEIDFLLANPSLYVELERFHAASRIVTLKNLHGDKTATVYAGAVFCLADRSDIRGLGDLKGKRFMAANEESFGGWQMAWREFMGRDIDPQNDFSPLEFADTQDAVVFAVRDGKVDAGTVRADLLQQMVLEGQIEAGQFRVLDPRHEEDDPLPFPHTTQVYPEWPMAKLRHTSDDLAQEVAIALLRLTPETPAAKAAGCAGWVIPQNYQSVHECLRELRVGPYRDYGRVPLSAVVRRYWPWMVMVVAALMLAGMVSMHVMRLNRALRHALAQHQKELVDRRRAEETVRLSETRLRQIIDLVPHMIFAKNREGRFLLANQTLAEAYGMTVEEVTGRKQAEIHPAEEELRRMLEDDRNVIESGQAKSIRQESFKDAQGSVRWLQTIKIPYTASGTSEPAMLGVAIDVTELKKAEEALRKSEQLRAESEKLAAIGRLAAGVAHEVNNPLTGVLTFSHLLREKENLDEQDREDLDLIIGETTRVSQIVRNLLDFARERPAAKQQLDINEVVRQTVRLLGNQKAFRQITMHEQLSDDLPLIHADRNQMQQVLLNLSLNACEAMPDGGRLTISTSAHDHQVEVKVTDTGCGIKEEHLDQIFEPFFSTKPVGKGTGLGLSVSYGIVQQHGGTLEVESQEGVGTTFTVTLAAAEDQRPKPRDGESHR